MLQNMRSQNAYLRPPADNVTQSNHYVNDRECNGLVQLSAIVSQSSSQNYGSVGEIYTTPQEIHKMKLMKLSKSES